MHWLMTDRVRKLHSCAYYEFSKPYQHGLSGSLSEGYYYVYVTHTRHELDSLIRCSYPDDLAQ